MPVDELSRLRALVSDVSRQLAVSAPAPVQVSSSVAAVTKAPFWTAEVMDSGGASKLGAVSGDWNALFEQKVDSGGSAVDVYGYAWPTCLGEIVGNLRGLEGDHRFRLNLRSASAQQVKALFTYSTDSASADIQLIVNGVVTRTSFVSPSINGDAITINLNQGSNLITIIANLNVDMFALYWNPLGPFATWQEV